MTRHPAMYWRQLEHHRVKCLLCPHQCVLANGETGQCGVRQNKDGLLVALTYGHPVAMHIDPVEKKPLYHFHPGSQVFSIATGGCNLHCLHCQNWEISQQVNTSTPYTPPEKVLTMAQESGCQAIAYTYTEPLVWYEYLLDMAKLARIAKIANILVSAGYIHPRPLQRLLPYLDAANIDLKSFSDEHYRTINGAALQPVLDTILILKKAGVWLEITQLLIPGINTEEGMIRQTVGWLLENGMENVPIHFSRYHPAYHMMEPSPTPESMVLEACRLARSMGMNYVYAGNLMSHQFEDTLCPSCGRTLIERQGYRIRIVEPNLPLCGHCQQRVEGRFGE